MGWSIDQDMRTTLVVDALGMAITRRHTEPYSAVLHSDPGAQYAGWPEAAGPERRQLAASDARSLRAR